VQNSEGGQGVRLARTALLYGFTEARGIESSVAGSVMDVRWHVLCGKSALKHVVSSHERRFTMTTPQRTEGEGKQPTHTHPASEHTHDHYHVTHHHVSGVAGALAEFEHRAYWHTHAHNHAELTHSHDYDQVAEGTEHAKEAHVHDHAAPTHSHT
jgi:hypothetical protein